MSSIRQLDLTIDCGNSRMRTARLIRNYKRSNTRNSMDETEKSKLSYVPSSLWLCYSDCLDTKDVGRTIKSTLQIEPIHKLSGSLRGFVVQYVLELLFSPLHVSRLTFILKDLSLYVFKVKSIKIYHHLHLGLHRFYKKGTVKKRALWRFYNKTIFLS